MSGPIMPWMMQQDELEAAYPSPASMQSGMAAQPPITDPRAPWAARFFGGADPLQQGLVSHEQAGGLGRQALFNAGLNILANSGPAPYRRGLGEILAGGIQAGQQSYQAGASQALGQEGVLAQRQSQRRLEQIRQRYQGRNDPASLTAMMHDLIGLGTQESLAGARSISEVLKSQRGSRLIRSVETINGQPKVVFRESETGEIRQIGDGQERGSEMPAYLTDEGIARRVRLARLLNEENVLSPGERERVRVLGELASLTEDIIEEGGLLDRDPSSVGAQNMFGDWLNARVDPEGIPLRATLSNLRTTIRQLRSGAAVTESEAIQLRAMLPSETDNEQTVRTKLRTLSVHLNRLMATSATRKVGAAQSPAAPTTGYTPPPR